MVEIKKIIQAIQKNKSFIITAHMNLEGDALGSELAVYRMLKKIGKKVSIINHDHTPAIYKFMPSSGVVKNEMTEEKVDVAIVLDCSDPYRPGRVKDYLSRAKLIINIDHHISNTYFGDINWVEPLQSSTCQMLYTLCERMKLMDKDIATCLYTGIYTDTGKFSYSNTNSETHRVVAELMDYKIVPTAIHEALSSVCVPDDMSFISKVLGSLQFDDNQQICWAAIDNWVEGDYDLTEIIFSVMRLLKDVEVFVLFKRLEEKRIRVNFRSRAVVDVNRIAKFFGGGGHKRASGTTIEDTLYNTEKKVMDFIKRFTNGKAKRI